MSTTGISHIINKYQRKKYQLKFNVMMKENNQVGLGRLGDIYGRRQPLARVQTLAVHVFLFSITCDSCHLSESSKQGK